MALTLMVEIDDDIGSRYKLLGKTNNQNCRNLIGQLELIKAKLITDIIEAEKEYGE